MLTLPSASRAAAAPTQAARDYARVARAIEFIRSRSQAQPSLAEVAAAVHLSEFHLQRLFTRWAGLSPKRFLQVVTVEHAKQRLAARADVLDATLDVGLSSPGRLHDLLVNLEAATPGEFGSGGAGLRIRYGYHATPLGTCFAATTARGLCALEFVAGPAERAAALERLRGTWVRAEIQPDAGATAGVVEQAFFRRHPGAAAGEPLSVLVSGTNLQVQVWRALLNLPRGHVGTYTQVARQIGRPAAVRAVASAIGANPVGYVIPCHRVLRSDGTLGGYRWGLTRKLAALALEARTEGPAA